MRPIWSVVAVLAVGCGGGGKQPDAGTSDATVPDAAPDPRGTVLEVPATPIADLDLLFMIDDSAGCRTSNKPSRIPSRRCSIG